MASLSTFAKLSKPPQFRPAAGTNVTFDLQFSYDLAGMYATLVIEGYLLRFDEEETVYTGTKSTKIVVSSYGREWNVGDERYTIDSTLLGRTPENSVVTIYCTGKMKAYVLFGNTVDGSGHVTKENALFKSNEVLVGMVIMRDKDFAFYDTPYTADCSVFTPELQYNAIYDYGTYGDVDINSYKISLYDENKNLLEQSPVMTDWDHIHWRGYGYTFKGLVDGRDYYLRGEAMLVGGYEIFTDYEPLEADFAPAPSHSPEMNVKSSPSGVEIVLDLTGVTHDRTVISRTVYGENTYLELKSVNETGNTVKFTDKYAIPEHTYTYKAVAYSGNSIAGTYYANIPYKSNVVKISDAYGCYTAVGDITKHPISRNDRGNIVNVMDSVYPYYIINGEADYDSGSVDALFSEIEDCSPVLNNSGYADILRKWLNNGHAKLLTYYTGEAWVVSVSGIKTTDPDNTDTLNTSFEWTEVGDAENVLKYGDYGLISEE